ncbi:hypothetical protein E1289_21260 [Actinomadura sp. 6K520]|nr:hypothetical protein E1289_21260 [Actinomadura sp. 6K520]
MSDHNGSGDLDRRTAERVLDGAAEHARLHALLAAASAPARPGELAGEDTAVIAFKAARLPARTSRMAALRRFLTIKALVLVGGSLILTGGAAAYATMNGHIPGRAPAPSTTPTMGDRTGTGQHSNPVVQVTPRSGTPASPQPSTSRPSDAPSSTPPPATKRPPATPGPSNGPGGGSTPGPPNQTAPPGNPSPPRGRGNNNGVPPDQDSGKGKENDGAAQAPTPEAQAANPPDRAGVTGSPRTAARQHPTVSGPTTRTTSA